MSLVGALNLLWAFLAASALLRFAVAECRCASFHSGRGLQRRLSALILVLLSLFPCVSASDDLMRFSYLESFRALAGANSSSPPEVPDSPAGSSPTGRDSSTLTLVRLLQSLEGCNVAAIFIFALAFSCFGFVYLSRFKNRALDPILLPGRGPPAFSL